MANYDTALAEDVRNAIRLEDDPRTLLTRVSLSIIHHYLGNSFFQERVWLSKSPDPFLLNGFWDTETNEGKQHIFLHHTRVIALADSLFALRDCNGFDVLVRRFRERDTRAPFYEARIAAIVRESGFSVTIRPETGVRGQDFDFQAQKGDQLINVEVTEFLGAVLDKKTIQNKLRNKRTQFPNDAPAALCLSFHQIGQSNHPVLSSI